MARVTAEKVGLTPPFTLVLAGGALRGDGAELLAAELLDHVPGGESAREPAPGALLAALDRTGADTTSRWSTRRFPVRRSSAQTRVATTCT